MLEVSIHLRPWKTKQLTFAWGEQLKAAANSGMFDTVPCTR